MGNQAAEAELLAVAVVQVVRDVLVSVEIPADSLAPAGVVGQVD